MEDPSPDEWYWVSSGSKKGGGVRDDSKRTEDGAKLTQALMDKCKRMLSQGMGVKATKQGNVDFPPRNFLSMKSESPKNLAREKAYAVFNEDIRALAESCNITSGKWCLLPTRAPFRPLLSQSDYKASLVL